MPRGRHRHEQPLHRLLPPAAVAAAALACAGGAWLVGPAGLGDTDTVVLRGLAAAAALAAVTGAVLTRRWDRRAGRRVAELDARRASMEWRAEEREAEHEAELEEARELRAAVERKLTARRAELGRLRNEHAALLRRYANAETERASALEGRRLLELEAAAPVRAALTSGAADHRSASGAPTPLTYLQASEALRHLRRSAERQRRLRAVEGGEADGPPTPASPAAAAAPVPPPAVRPAPAPRRPGGGFDFFGSAGAKPAGAARASGPAPRRDAGSPGTAEDAEPEPAPRSRRTHPAAGKVVDLADDAAALDITELRSALP